MNCSYGCGNEAGFYFKSSREGGPKWSCSKNPKQCPAIKEKTRRTNIEKFGGPAPQCSKRIRQKTKQTNLQKYGVENVMQNNEIKHKSLESHFRNNGVHNVWQHPKGRSKYEETMLERHGVSNPGLSNYIQEKIRTTNIERYGSANVGGLPKFREKAQKTCRERYGNNMPNCSKGQIEWLDSLGISSANREVLIEGYRVDGYDPETNTVYEYNGDYWHGNPKLFETNGICRNGKTFGELYEQTKQKEQDLLDVGFTVVSIWESEWNQTK